MVTLKNIKKKGGITLCYNGIEHKSYSGYQVSKQDLFITPVYKLRMRDIKNALNRLAATEYLGIWIENGKAYVDISETIRTKREAIKVGKQRKQISIYGWKQQTCYYC